MCLISLPSNRFNICSAKKMRCFFSLTVLLFFLCGSATTFTNAQEESQSTLLRFEAILPEDNALFIKCSGINQLLADGRTLDFVKLWMDPEVKDFFSEAIEAIPDELPEGDEPRIPYKELWSLCRGEVAFALMSGLSNESEAPIPSMVLCLEMGTGNETFLEAIQSFLNDFAWSWNLTQEKVEYKGIEIHSVGPLARGLGFHRCKIENLFLAALNQNDLKNIIDRHLDDQPALADNPVYLKSLERVAGESIDLLAFFHFTPFLKIVKPFLSYNLENWLKILGLDQVQALCLATSIESGGSRDSLYINCPGEKGGILKALSPKPFSSSALKQASPDTLIFLGLTLDLKMLLKEAEMVMQNALPAFLEAYSSFKESMKTQMNLDLEEEVLPILGQEFSFCLTMPRSGGMFPDYMFSFSVEDDEGFSAIQDKLLALLKGVVEVGESTYDEKVLYNIQIPQSQIPLSPTFAKTEGRLLLSGTTLAMKKYLRWLKKESPGLGESEDFKAAMGSVPDAASFLSFMNLRRQVEIGYGAAGPFLPALLAQSDVPLDAAMLPMTETITDYISNASCFMAMDEEGLLLSSSSPLGLGALLSIFVSSVDYFIEQDLLPDLLALRSSIPSGRGRVSPEQDPELGEIFTEMRNNRFESAEKNLSKWLRQNPHNGLFFLWVLRNRAECRMKQNRYEDAVEDYEWLAEEDKASQGFAYYNIARAYTMAEDTEKAIPYVEKAIAAGHRIFENDSELSNLQGNPQFDQFIDMVIITSHFMADGQYGEAEKNITEWIFNNPYHNLTGWALKNRGDCYKWLEQYEEAIVDYEKAAERESSYESSVFYDIACICSLNDEADRAIDYLKKAMDAGFEDFDLIDNDSDLDNIRDDSRFRALRWRW